MPAVLELFPLSQPGSPARLLRRFRVLRGDRRDPARLVAYLVGITWVPLVLLAIIGRLRRDPLDPLLRQPAVHVRLLVALPLLVVAGRLLPALAGLVFGRLANDGPLPDPRPLERIARQGARWAQSPTIAVVLAAVAFSAAHNVFRTHAVSQGAVTPAQLWYGWVSLPVLLFLALGVLWRWCVWCSSLWQVSRLELVTDPMHPDHATGLAFLARPTVALALVVLAVSAVTSTSWAVRLLKQEVPIQSLALPFAAFVVVSLAVAVLPTLPFLGRMARSSWRGLWEYDHFAFTYDRRFVERWMRRPESEELLGSADIQSLSDLGQAYERLRRIHFLPFGKAQAIEIVAAAVIPMVPLVLTQIPLSELVPKLMRAVLG